MTNGKLLVTSAAGGTRGRTGRHVTEMLLKRNVPVRAFATAPA
jgi:uncharacterized protein YbjT (DUF2867 family)